MRTAIVALCFAAALLAGCSGDSQVQRLYGSRHRLDVIAHPTKVEAYRDAAETPRRVEAIYSSKPQSQPSSAPTTGPVLPGGLLVLAGPAGVDNATAAELSRILHDPNTYMFGLGKGCMFNPDIAVRFAAADCESVIVVFCFTCDELEIYDGATRKSVGGGNDDPWRPRLVAIAKRLFPNDSYIAELKPQRK